MWPPPSSSVAVISFPACTAFQFYHFSLKNQNHLWSKNILGGELAVGQEGADSPPFLMVAAKRLRFASSSVQCLQCPVLVSYHWRHWTLTLCAKSGRSVG